MFSGIGGFELGIQQAYGLSQMEIKSKNRTNNKGGTPQYSKRPFCIGYSEVDKHAIQIYRKHFLNHQNYGNATKIDTSKLPDFDLLVAGFPCQSFSVAGRGKGFDDTRGTLFFEIARVLRDKRPRYFLLENVKGLLSNKSGKTFQTILGVLTNLGYELEWQVLNSKNFGVPQNRERVFIIGYFGKGSRSKVFPITEGDGKNYKKHFKTLNLSDWRGANRNQGQNLIKVIDVNNQQGQRVYDPKGISQTLAGNAGGWGGKTGLYAMRGRENGQRLEYRGNETNALTSVQKDNLWIENMKIRRLTPLEAERLQGFPDNFTEYGIDENGNKVKISDTQRYKVLGNAITVNVVEAIIKNLKTQL